MRKLGASRWQHRRIYWIPSTANAIQQWRVWRRWSLCCGALWFGGEKFQWQRQDQHQDYSDVLPKIWCKRFGYFSSRLKRRIWSWNEESCRRRENCSRITATRVMKYNNGEFLTASSWQLKLIVVLILNRHESNQFWWAIKSLMRILCSFHEVQLLCFKHYYMENFIQHSR